MIWGAPGIGKTDVAKQITKRRMQKLICFLLSIREPVDLRGVPGINPLTKTTDWYPPSELPQVERDGADGTLLLDEINTNPQMMPPAMHLVLEREIGDYKLPAGWAIIATGNRVGDKAAAQRMPTALRNRFAHVHVEPDLVSWANWATQNGVAPELVAFLRLRQGENGGKGILHVMPRGDENAFPTPRSWVKAQKYVNAPAKHRIKLFAAHVGAAYAAEFDAFIELFRSLGDLKDIIANPTTARVPTEPSARYAVCTGLARMATKANIANVVTYAKQLQHRESEVLVMHDMTTRDPALKNTKAYGAWAVENQNLVIQ